MMQDDIDSQAASPGPPKKRRYSRVSRACNECRVRKIRCNGKSPCERCEEFDRHCTYKSTKGQRVAGAPRTKILEDRLRRARGLITKLQSQHPSPHLTTEVDAIFDSPPGSPSSASDTPALPDDGQADRLEIMLDARGRIISNHKSPEYYGPGSCFAFLQTMDQFFRHRSHDALPADHASYDDISRLFESPLPPKESLAVDAPFLDLLPSRQTTRELAHVVFRQSYQLLNFFHEPTFLESADRLYDLHPINFEDSDRQFLPLLFSVTALGLLYHQGSHQKYGCKEAIDEAMRYFTVARSMVDVDQCRDLVSLQCILCLVLFLISTARLATAHRFISIAVAASTRMGLHSRASCEGLDPFEQNLRRRVFWTIIKLDLYSGTILGLPPLVDLHYVDQLKPADFSRDYADEEHGGYTSSSTRRAFAASAQYIEALMITNKVVRKLYPKTDAEAEARAGSNKVLITSTAIAEIEADFKKWRNRLSDALGPADSPQSASMSSIVYELEMIHNFGHILLYRPFLHYLTRTKSEHPPEPRLLKCAISCLKIARFTISRSDEMLKQGLFAPAAWQSVYTIFLSLVALIYFLTTQHGNREYVAIQREMETGVRILASTSCQDIGSQRCLDALQALCTKLSYIIDVDIEGIRAETRSKCCFSAEKYKQQSRQASRSPPDDQRPRKNQSVSGKSVAHEKPKIRTDQRQFPYRTQPPPASVPPPHPSMHGLPVYHSPTGPYSNAQLPIWEQPVVFDSSDPRFGQNMHVTYNEGFHWTSDAATANPPAGRGSHQTPNSSHLAQEDISNFMQISSGDENFLH